MAKGLEMIPSKMIEIASKVLNNRDMAEEKKKDTEMKNQTARFEVALCSGPGNPRKYDASGEYHNPSFHGGTGPLTYQSLGQDQCAYFNQQGHCKRVCPNSTREGWWESPNAP